MPHLEWDEELMVHRNVFWNCPDCGAQNHEMDAECQFCVNGVPNG